MLFLWGCGASGLDGISEEFQVFIGVCCLLLGTAVPSPVIPPVLSRDGAVISSVL